MDRSISVNFEGFTVTSRLGYETARLIKNVETIRPWKFYQHKKAQTLSAKSTSSCNPFLIHSVKSKDSTSKKKKKLQLLEK